MGFSVAPNRWRFDAGRSNRSLGQVLGIQQYNNLLYFDCALFPHAPQSWKSRYHFRWRLDLAAVHLTVALGRFAMDTSTVQQNGGCRIPWGRGGEGGRNDYFCRLLFDVILLSFNLSPSTWVFPLCESVRHGLFPVKAMRRGPTGIRPTQQLRHTETVFPRNLSIGMPASLTGLRGVKFI